MVIHGYSIILFQTHMYSQTKQTLHDNQLLIIYNYWFKNYWYNVLFVNFLATFYSTFIVILQYNKCLLPWCCLLLHSSDTLLGTQVGRENVPHTITPPPAWT